MLELRTIAQVSSQSGRVCEVRNNGHLLTSVTRVLVGYFGLGGRPLGLSGCAGLCYVAPTQPTGNMNEVTLILDRVHQGDPKAADELLPLVYEELRRLAACRMANEAPGHTLQPTALVHEAWLRLLGSEVDQWNGRGHFFAAAAEAMRRILVEAARRKSRARHGGGVERVSAEEMEIPAELPADRLLQVNEALDRLAEEAPEAAQVVKLRYFAGLTQPEVARMLGISLRAAERHWTWAKAWLFQWIRQQEKG
jgi:RNA polymerase sigma factor (TIGR02999 family)